MKAKKKGAVGTSIPKSDFRPYRVAILKVPRKSQATTPSTKADPTSQRREIARLVDEHASLTAKIIKFLPGWNFEIPLQIPSEDWSATALKKAAKLEAESVHYNMVTELRQSCLDLADALRKHAVRHPRQTDPIIAASAHWPAAISIHPALDAAQAFATVKKKLGLSLGYETQRLKKRTVWQRLVERIIGDIEKHLADAEKFRKAGMPWLLDFVDDNGKRFQLPTDNWKTGDPAAWLVAIAYYSDLVFAPKSDRNKIRALWFNSRRDAWKKAATKIPQKKLEAARQGSRRLDEPVAISHVHRYLNHFPLATPLPLVQGKDPTIRSLVEKPPANGNLWVAHRRCVEKIQNAFLRYRGLDPDEFERPKLKLPRPR